MSKSKGGGLYTYRQDNGILLARTNQFANPLTVSELISIPTYDLSGNHFAALTPYNAHQKGYCEAHFVASHPDFQHYFHQSEGIPRKNAAEYIPGIVKEWLGVENSDFFFQVLDWETGELVPVENPTQKSMLVSGMNTKKLEKLQSQITEQNFYPKRLENSIVLMLGLIRRLIKESKLQGPVLLLEIYRDSGVLIVIPSEGVPLLRTIDSGESAMYEQIRTELSLKDVSSARKLMHSSTIDLSDIGRQVVNPVFKEIASTVGSFEVETGQSISQMIVPNFLPNQRWIVEVMANDFGMTIPEFDMNEIGGLFGVAFEEDLEWDPRDLRILPLIAAMGAL